MSETCAVCHKGKGPTQCEVCGFTDNGVINREWPIEDDAKYWLETVVKPYKIQWEAKKREAELLSQIEEYRIKNMNILEQLSDSRKNEMNLQYQLEMSQKNEKNLLIELNRIQLEAKKRKKNS